MFAVIIIEKFATGQLPNWGECSCAGLGGAHLQTRGFRIEILSSGFPGRVGGSGTPGLVPHWRNRQQNLSCPLRTQAFGALPHRAPALALSLGGDAARTRDLTACWGGQVGRQLREAGGRRGGRRRGQGCGRGRGARTASQPPGAEAWLPSFPRREVGEPGSVSWAALETEPGASGLKAAAPRFPAGRPLGALPRPEVISPPLPHAKAWCGSDGPASPRRYGSRQLSQALQEPKPVPGPRVGKEKEEEQ